MVDALKQMFGIGPKVDYAVLKKEGAIILDVRSKEEFAGGHIKGSINIPVQNLKSNLAKVKKGKPIITCCASGMRSGQAKSILLENGYSEVYNGGGWQSLNSKL